MHMLVVLLYCLGFVVSSWLWLGLLLFSYVIGQVI